MFKLNHDKAAEPRVLFFIPAFSDGGAQIQCISLINQLAESGIRVSLVRLRPGVHDKLLTARLELDVMIGTGSPYSARTLVELARLLRRSKPDIIFSWLHSADVLAFACSRLAPRVAWVMAERDSSYPRALRYRVREVVGKFATMIIANSEAGRNYWEQLGAQCSIALIPNIVAGLPTRRVQSNRVISVGRLEPQKDPLAIAEALAQVAESNPSVDCWMVGEGSLRSSVETHLSGIPGGRRVKLQGYLPDARARIGESRVLVNLSRHEGSPNVVLEAIAQGVVVVLSDIAEHRAIVGDRYPYLVPVGDSQLASEAIATALADSTSPVEEARARIAREQSGPVVAGTYRQLFEDLVAH